MTEHDENQVPYAGAVAASLLRMLTRTWRGRDALASMPAEVRLQLEYAAADAGLTWRDEPPFTEPAGARPRSHITAVLQAGYRRAAAEEKLMAERAATGKTTKAAERAHHDADREMHARALAAIKYGISSDTLAFAVDFHHLR